MYRNKIYKKFKKKFEKNLKKKFEKNLKKIQKKNPIAIYYIYYNIYNIIRHGWVRSVALVKASVPWVGVGMGG
jgi:hypothetical protein